MFRQIFVNLPIKDMARSQAFFKALGLTFNQRFTNEQGACLEIGENFFAMLLVEPFFQGFTKKPISDAQKATEVILALSVDSRAEAEEVVRQAVAAGDHAQCAAGPRFHVPARLCRPGRPPVGGVLDGRSSSARTDVEAARAFGCPRLHCRRLAH